LSRVFLVSQKKFGKNRQDNLAPTFSTRFKIIQYTQRRETDCFKLADLCAAGTSHHAGKRVYDFGFIYLFIPEIDFLRAHIKTFFATIAFLLIYSRIPGNIFSGNSLISVAARFSLTRKTAYLLLAIKGVFPEQSLRVNGFLFGRDIVFFSRRVDQPCCNFLVRLLVRLIKFFKYLLQTHHSDELIPNKNHFSFLVHRFSLECKVLRSW
jgi:hypothetical protein